MTLASSGTISIGGSTANRSINLELGRSATASSNLNESLLRNLAQVSSGAIALSNFYGKSYYYRASGNVSPTQGSSGSPTWPPTGWTSLQNASADDAFVSTSIPNLIITNTTYSTAYIGSNTYITFGGGSTAYSSLSGSNPPYNKFMFGASDNSYQRVAYINSGSQYTRIRYEGNGATSGTPGSPGIVYEVTFFNLNSTNLRPLVELRVGVHNRTEGLFGVASTTAFYANQTIAANTSYVFQSNDTTGQSWTIYSSSYVAGW